MALRDVFDNILQSAKVKASGGFTGAELGELLHEAVYLLVDEAENYTGIKGVDKKKLVLENLGKLFDEVAPLVPVPVWYLPFQPFVRPLSKKLLLWVADGLIDVIVRRMNAGKGKLDAVKV